MEIGHYAHRPFIGRGPSWRASRMPPQRIGESEIEPFEGTIKAFCPKECDEHSKQ